MRVENMTDREKRAAGKKQNAVPDFSVTMPHDDEMMRLADAQLDALVRGEPVPQPSVIYEKRKTVQHESRKRCRARRATSSSAPEGMATDSNDDSSSSSSDSDDDICAKVKCATDRLRVMNTARVQRQKLLLQCLQLLNHELDMSAFAKLVGLIEVADNAFLTIHKSATVLKFLRALKAAMLEDSKTDPLKLGVFNTDRVLRVRLLSTLRFEDFVTLFTDVRERPECCVLHEWVGKYVFCIHADPKEVAAETARIMGRDAPTPVHDNTATTATGSFGFNWSQPQPQPQPPAALSPCPPAPALVINVADYNVKEHALAPGNSLWIGSARSGRTAATLDHVMALAPHFEQVIVVTHSTDTRVQFANTTFGTVTFVDCERVMNVVLSLPEEQCKGLCIIFDDSFLSSNEARHYHSAYVELLRCARRMGITTITTGHHSRCIGPQARLTYQRVAIGNVKPDTLRDFYDHFVADLQQLGVRTFTEFTNMHHALVHGKIGKFLVFDRSDTEDMWLYETRRIEDIPSTKLKTNDAVLKQLLP